MHTNILDATLGEWADRGYKLQEEGDHTAIIFFKEKYVARISQHASVQAIRELCQKHWDSLNGDRYGL